MNTLEEIGDFIWNHKQYLLNAVLIVIVGILVYQVAITYKEEPVTYESQKQAETKEGVTKAAEKADVKLSDSQTKEVVREIQTIRETKQEPVYIVQTTGNKVEEVVQEEVKKNKADFAIVTNPEKPDEEVDVSKLKEEDKVQLNQYNINAYKKVIRQVSIGRAVTGDDKDYIIGASISKKISDDGKYLGVGIDQTFGGSNNKTYLKVIYSW